MFELDQQEVRCTSASTNSENKGKSEDTRLGMSLYFEFTGPNDLLDKLDPKLRPALYTRAAEGKQEDMTEHMPDLKFEKFPPLAWPYLGSGYEATIHSELEFSQTFELDDCKVDKITLTPRDGGVCGYKFRIYFHPELGDVGKLAAMEKHAVTLTLMPPGIGEEQQKAA